MSGKQKAILKRCTVSIILFIIIITIIGCDSDTPFVYTGDYEKIEVTEGIAHFSFEYPSFLNEDLLETFDNQTRVGLASTDIENGYYKNMIVVNVSKSGLIYSSAEKATNSYLSYYSQYYPKYKLLEKSTITLGGVKAFKLVFSYVTSPDFQPTVDIPMKDVEIYFDYGGMVWEIEVGSSQDAIGQEECYFQHILDTFKFLD